ncbi:hypothetical protein HpBT060_14660 [Helicobacter pylori]
MPRYFLKGGGLAPLEDYDTWFNNLRQNVKTSDDSFTPPKVYEAVIEYINEKIIPLDSIEIQRPFYPGGDYQKDSEFYNEKSVVIDNPPFSISSEIIDFYIKNNIKFFIFVSGLTCFSYLDKDVHLLCPYASIKYDNGAKVVTCFAHNLLPKGVTISGELRKRLEILLTKKQRDKFQYPNEILSVKQCLKLSKQLKGEVTITKYRGVCGLNYKGKQKKIFAKGMLLSKSEQEKLDKIIEEHKSEQEKLDEIMEEHELNKRDGEIIKFTLSEKQIKYREALEN